MPMSIPVAPKVQHELRRAPPIGRALRLLFGLALSAYAVPVYFEVDARVSVGALLLLLGLIGAYSLIHLLVSRRVVVLGTSTGAIAALGLLIVVYVVGGPGGILLGRGEGALASVTFLALSLVTAGVRADPGCEVMAIPGALFGSHTELACLVFSPLDALEHKVRRK